MQKFHKYDLVRLTDDLGPYMSHFHGAGEKAIVIGSYSDKFGGSNTDSYTLFFREHGEISWYYEHQITLIKSQQDGLLEQWKDYRWLRDKQHSDLDWIFGNGPELLSESIPGVSVDSLAKCMKVHNLWGSRGEGITWYTNARIVVETAKPFLLARDKRGWLNLCSRIESEIRT